MTSPLILLAAWMVPLLAPAPNEGLRRERLPDDVDFVAHFDFEGFKATQLWKSLAEEVDLHEIRAGFEGLDELHEELGIDPLTEIRAVTLFKMRSEEEPTVVLLSTTAAVDQALKKLQGDKGYRRIQSRGIELHTWREHGDDDQAYAYVHPASGDERVVVLASNEASAVRAARVLRGEEPNHLQSGTALVLAPAQGSFLYVAATGFPGLEDDTPASRVFGLAQGIQVDLGEAGGFLRAHMGLGTGSPEDAFDVSGVVNGLISLARLAGSEAGEALELLTGLRLGTRGSEVQVDFEFEVARLLEILKSLDEDVEEHVIEHVEKHHREGARRRER